MKWKIHISPILLRLIHGPLELLTHQCIGSGLIFDQWFNLTWKKKLIQSVKTWEIVWPDPILRRIKSRLKIFNLIIFLNQIWPDVWSDLVALHHPFIPLWKHLLVMQKWVLVDYFGTLLVPPSFSFDLAHVIRIYDHVGDGCVNLNAWRPSIYCRVVECTSRVLWRVCMSAM